jgi:hypothetical protein
MNFSEFFKEYRPHKGEQYYRWNSIWVLTVANIIKNLSHCEVPEFVTNINCISLNLSYEQMYHVKGLFFFENIYAVRVTEKLCLTVIEQT